MDDDVVKTDGKRGNEKRLTGSSVKEDAQVGACLMTCTLVDVLTILNRK